MHTRTHKRMCPYTCPRGETPNKPVSFSWVGGLQAIFFLFLFSNTSPNNMYYLHDFLKFRIKALLSNTTESAMKKQLAKITLHSKKLGK